MIWKIIRRTKKASRNGWNNIPQVGEVEELKEDKAIQMQGNKIPF
jgi:hypothetical protein